MGVFSSSLCWFSCCMGNLPQEEKLIGSKIISSQQKSFSKFPPKMKVSYTSTDSTNSHRQLFLLDGSVSADKSDRDSSVKSSYVQKANHLCQRGNFQAAINNYMMVLHKVDRRDIKMADIHYTIAQCYFRMGNFNTAMKHCKLAFVKYTELTGKKSQGVAMVCNLIGHIQTQVYDYVLAQHYYEKAYGIYLQQANNNYQNLLEVGFNLAALYLSIDKDEKSLQIYEEIEGFIEKDRNIAGNSIILQLYRCIGVNCFKLGLYERSMQYFKKAFELSLCLIHLKNNEIQKLFNSFKLIKEYILTNPALKKSVLAQLTIRRFLELEHRMS